MANKLSSSLKADLPALAELLRSKGRGRDTILAHITPKEAALLKRRGGSGTINPSTGLPEFEDADVYDYSAPADVSPVYDVVTGGNYDGGGYDYTFTPTIDYQGEPQQYAPAYTEPYIPAYGGYDYGGGGDYAPAPDQGTVQQQAALLLSGLGGSIEEPLSTSASFAAANPQLYPGGELPLPGYSTIYTPQGQAAYAPTEDLDAYIKASGLSEDDKKKVEEEVKRTGRDWKDALMGLAAAGLIGGFLSKRQQQAGTDAAKQAQQAADRVQAIATPYQVRGSGLMRAAEKGELSAANQQIVNAARAQAAQNIRRRGGVGVLQYANSIADLTDRLLQNQFNQGLAVSQIGDNYSLQAINTALSGQQAVTQANANFYTQMAQMLSRYIFQTLGTNAPTAAQRQTGITA